MTDHYLHDDHYDIWPDDEPGHHLDGEPDDLYGLHPDESAELVRPEYHSHREEWQETLTRSQHIGAFLVGALLTGSPGHYRRVTAAECLDMLGEVTAISDYLVLAHASDLLTASWSSGSPVLDSSGTVADPSVVERLFDLGVRWLMGFGAARGWDPSRPARRHLAAARDAMALLGEHRIDGVLDAVSCVAVHVGDLETVRFYLDLWSVTDEEWM